MLFASFLPESSIASNPPETPALDGVLNAVNFTAAFVGAYANTTALAIKNRSNTFFIVSPFIFYDYFIFLN